MNQKHFSAWDHLEKNIGIWASQTSGVVAALAVGSRVRHDPPADEWSDLDIFLFVNEPSKFANQTAWIGEIAEALLSVPTRTANNDPARQVLYSGGYAVDYVFLPVKAIDWLSEHGTQVEPFSRGARVLADRDGRLKKLFPNDQPLTKITMNPAPTSPEFAHALQTFWYLAHTHARLLARGDLWAARGTDYQLKETLSSALALHAVVVGKREDVWPQGRFMDRWADQQTLEEIPGTYWSFDALQAWNALACMQTIFKRLSGEICTTLNYPYPTELVRRMEALIQAMRPA